MDLQGIATAIVTSGVVSGLVTLGTQTYLKGKINHHFSRKLEEFKGELTVQAEHRKLDFDRKIHDFSIYSTKRYEIYPDLFKQIYGLQAFLFQKEIIDSLPESVASIKEITDFLETREIPLLEKGLLRVEKLFPPYKEAREQPNAELAAERLELMKRSIELDVLFSMNIRIRDTSRFFAENILYLSDDVSSKTSKFLNTLTKYSNPNEELDQSAKAMIEGLIEDLRKTLKKELSVGDYS